MNIINPFPQLGDTIMLTGIPEAFYARFGNKVYIENRKMEELWDTNPYVSKEKVGDYSWSVTGNAKRDYMIYYPVRLFYDLTGLIVHRDLVQPKIYKPYVPHKGIIVNDQTGWPNRRGYRYFNELLAEVKRQTGFPITYIRNPGKRDCFGDISEQEIKVFDWLVENPDNATLISLFSTANLYIGYESGFNHLASAFGCPTVILQSSVPPINTRHNSCIYTAEICASYCCHPDCGRNCLTTAPNINKEIVDTIVRHFDLYSSNKGNNLE